MNKLILYLTLVLLFLISAIFHLDVAAQEVELAKFQIQRTVVTALCDEKEFTKNGKYSLDSIPHVQEQFLKYYESCSGIKDPKKNVLRDYIRLADTLFSSEKSSPEDLEKYIDKLIEKLNDKTERKTTDFGKRLKEATNAVLINYSQAREHAEIADTYSATNTVTVGDSLQETISSEKQTDSNGYILWGVIAIAWLVALIAIGLSVRAGVTLKEEIAKRRDGKVEIEKINTQLSAMNKTLREVKSQLSSIDEGRKDLEEHMRELSFKQTNSQSPPVGQTTVAASNQNVSLIVEKPAPKVKYAVYADEGNAFSSSALKDAPSSETIFEITLLSENSAEFTVSESSAAQDMARSDIRLYLAETCSYSNSPSTSAFIKTVKRGKLRLNGSKWEIAEKATISFT
jgi:hypothetical protein